eukprot:12929795-Prorocentrum_lima.AAC.1
MGGRMCTNATGMGPVFLGAFLRSPPPLWLELSCSPRLSNGWWNPPSFQLESTAGGGWGSLAACPSSVAAGRSPVFVLRCRRLGPTPQPARCLGGWLPPPVSPAVSRGGSPLLWSRLLSVALVWVSGPPPPRGVWRLDCPRPKPTSLSRRFQGGGLPWRGAVAGASMLRWCSATPPRWSWLSKGTCRSLLSPEATAL